MWLCGWQPADKLNTSSSVSSSEVTAHKIIRVVVVLSFKLQLLQSRFHRLRNITDIQLSLKQDICSSVWNWTDSDYRLQFNCLHATLIHSLIFQDDVSTVSWRVQSSKCRCADLSVKTLTWAPAVLASSQRLLTTHSLVTQSSELSQHELLTLDCQTRTDWQQVNGSDVSTLKMNREFKDSLCFSLETERRSV